MISDQAGRVLLKIFLCLAAIAGLLFLGCSSPSQSEIPIGFAGPLTGKQANYGTMVFRGAELRVTELNAQSAATGFTYHLVRGDDQATPSQAVTVAQEFVSNARMPIVLGHFNSSCTLAAQTIYAAGKMPNVSYGATNDDVGKGTIWTFRTPYKNSLQGRSLARYAAAHGLKRVGILAENEDYGRGLADVFKAEAAKLGVAIEAQKSYDSDTSDYRSLFLAIDATHPDAILLSGFYPQLQVAAMQGRQVGVKAVFLAGDGVGSSTDYIQNAGAAAEGTVATGPFLIENDRKSVRGFRQKFKARYGEEPDSWAVYAYDAMGLADSAVRSAKGDRTAVRAALVGFNTPQKAFPGLVGPIWFDQDRNAVNDDVSLAVVKNGHYVVIPVR